MLEKGNPILLDAIEEGKILYSKPTIKPIIELYQSMKKKGLSKTTTTYILPKK